MIFLKKWFLFMVLMAFALVLNFLMLPHLRSAEALHGEALCVSHLQVIANALKDYKEKNKRFPLNLDELRSTHGLTDDVLLCKEPTRWPYSFTPEDASTLAYCSKHSLANGKFCRITKDFVVHGSSNPD